jgi:hypothetical protein
VQDENDRQYVRTTEIPEWMASIVGKLVPLVLIAVLGAGLVAWSQLAVLASRVEHLEGQANKGERFTAADGARMAARVGALELWREDHTKFGWEKTLQWNTQLNELQRKCDKGCQ